MYLINEFNLSRAGTKIPKSFDEERRKGGEVKKRKEEKDDGNGEQVREGGGGELDTICNLIRL